MNEKEIKAELLKIHIETLENPLPDDLEEELIRFVQQIRTDRNDLSSKQKSGRVE